MVTRTRSIPFKFNYIRLGTDIRATAQELGMTMADVAALSGVAPATVSALATHNEPNPKMNTWLAVVNALDLNPLDYLELNG